VNETRNDASHPVRQAVVQTLSSVEDLVYVGLGSALNNCRTHPADHRRSRVWCWPLWNRALGGQVVNLLDQILLILLVIELLYTVQVSFRERGLIAEPFLVVALIAVIRRVLVLTAEVPKLPGADEAVFRHAMLELAVLHRHGARARRFFDYAAKVRKARGVTDAGAARDSHNC